MKLQTMLRVRDFVRAQRAAPVAAALMCMAMAGAQADDGAAIMRKVHIAYGRLTSYTQKASGTIVRRVGNEQSLTGQTTELRYQQPNRLYIAVRSPQTGTIAAFSNGREMTIYRSSSNAYVKRAAPPTAKEFLKPLAVFGIAALLDPLDFLTGNTADPYVSAYSLRGRTRLNGAACYLVVGTPRPSSVPHTRAGRITFWVDISSYLIRKVQIVSAGTPAAIRGVRTVKGKRVATVTPVQVDQSVTEIVQEMQANPALNDSAFTYPIPRSATEQDAARVLGR